MQSSILPPWISVERVFNFIVGIVGLASFAVSINSENATLSSITNAVVILVLLGSFITYAFYVSRKERYADITRHVESVSDRCRIARGKLPGSPVTPEDERSRIQDDLEGVLNDIATIFAMLTGTPCRVALKIFRPLEQADKWYVLTWARDHQSALSHANGDRRRAEQKFDTLDKNPHLLALFSDDVDGDDWKCFNNVPKAICDGGYASSSLLWQMNISHQSSNDAGSHQLPYKSALVALVRSKAGVPIAFLGVDSAASGVFRTRSDGALLVALAGYVGALLEDALAGPRKHN